MVEHTQNQGLENNGFGEGRFDLENRRVGEIQLSLPISPDLTAEAEVGEPRQGVRSDDVALLQKGKLLVAESKLFDFVKKPAGSGDHSVPSPTGKAAREYFEHAVS